MLELGNDLFQTVVLGLLLVSLLVLLLLLNNLAKIKRTLEEGLARSQVGDITSIAASETPHTHEAHGASHHLAPESGATEPAWSSGATGGAGGGAAASSVWEQTASASPVATAATPAQQTAEPQAAHGVSAGPNPADMPEEQPVEHEGRWWFKRGGEILLYDEGTGQWGPAPEPAAAFSASQPAAASAYSDFKDLGSSSPEPETTGGGSAGGEASGFWKCASCSAVNGSTATSCRMCFAARPA